MTSPIDPIRRANQARRVRRSKNADASAETQDRSVPAIYEAPPRSWGRKASAPPTRGAAGGGGAS